MKQISMVDLRREYEYMKEKIDVCLQRCLKHQKWILGPEVTELEENIAHYLSVDHCVGVSSGTDALVLSLRALAIKTTGKEYFDQTDKIITTPFTFTATGDAILRSGATPVFMDIDPKTFNIDVNQIQAYLKDTSAKNVVGILPVHIYGLSCEMDQMMSLAKEHKLFVLEDVAQAFGGKWKGQKLGTIGDIGAFSFFPSKNLGGFGDGGLVSTNDIELNEYVQVLRKHGGKNKVAVDHIGYNARLDTLQAAVLLVKLNYIDEFNSRRRNIAEMYSKEFKKNPNIKVPSGSDHAEHVYHQYTIRVLNSKRDKLQKYFHQNNVETAVYYPTLLHDMNVFRSRCEVFGNLQESKKAVTEVLSLPIEPLLTEGEIQKVVSTCLLCWSSQLLKT